MGHERNPCVEAGCRGLCCFNRQIGMSTAEFERFLPEGVQAKELTEENLRVVGAMVTIAANTGVFYSRQGDRVAVQLVGPCPNLEASSSDCLIYKDRPQGCWNFKRGGTDCNSTRQDAGLSSVPQQLLEIS